MPTVDILYSYYYDEKGEIPKVGGIQTYITRLCELCIDMGLSVRVIQYGASSFSKTFDNGVKLIGIPTSKCDELYKEAIKSRDDGEYLTIFASDTLIPDVKVKSSIAIQHGIFWDIPKDRKESLFRSFLSKSITAYRIIKTISKVENVVCVDNNFINWYRTQIWQRDVNLIPIMNFTEIPKEEISKEEDRINIVFARRFVEYRGTRIFASAIKRVLEKYNNVYVTFAGEGPDGEFLSQMFKNDERVNITKYSSEESIEFHSKYHIAAVPTVGSEGTSLSLLEAMAAGCAVICSNVGGMTNIILDGYNGLMVNPDENSFYEGICELIDNNELREEIASNGRETVEKAFSLDRWNKKWKTTILNGFKKEQ